MVIEENESLRKGMHEILESIRQQDANSDIHLESNCLERLLEALDARHVAGWYHPAMRLQAQLHTVQGVAAELREQLRIAREQEREWKQHVGLALDRGEGFRAAVTDEADNRPASQKRMYIQQEGKPKTSDWSSEMRNLQGELKGLFNEVSKSLPLIANVRREHEEELAAQISDLQDSIEEYKRHLDGEKDHSVAVCAAKCATQRIAERSALRKCHSLEAARKNLSERLEKESVESVKRESVLGREIAAYRENEITLQNKINKLTNLLDRCVPMEEYKQTQNELSNATETLRQTLLEKGNNDNESGVLRDLQEKVKYFESKAESLTKELEKDRANLRVMQAQGQFPDSDQQLAALGQKLSALEISESTLTKKAEHAEKMYQLAKAQVIELEEEKREMEHLLLKNYSIKDSELAISEFKQILDVQDDFAKVTKLESELDLSRQEINSLKNIINSRNVEMDTIRELNQQLQSSGDLQATLGRITEDILSLRLELENVKFKLQESERFVEEEKRKNKKLKTMLKTMQGDHFDSAIVIHSRERIYKRKLLSICSRHTACVPLSTFELASKWLASTRSELDATKAERKALEVKVADLETEFEKLKIVQASQNEPQSDQLQEWQSRILQLRIKELESSRKAEHLEKECNDLKCQVVSLKTHSRMLEDERLELEKNWEQRLMNLEFEKSMSGVENIEKPIDKSKQEPEMVVEELDDPQQKEEKPNQKTHPHKKLIRRGTFTSLHDNTDVLKKELQSKEERISHLERMVDGQQGDSRAKLALEAMVASLSELVSLKEAAVVRARQRLKEAHDEHSNVTKELRRQLFDLQNSMAKLEGSKVREHTAPEVSQGPTVTKLLTQLHTVEDELRVSNHSAGTLAGQLKTLSGELQKWKDLAEARQTKLLSLQERFEEEESQAMAGRFSNIRIAEKAETERSEKELNSARSNIELARSRQEVENLREMVANMQEQIKKLQGKVNERRRRSQSFSLERPEKLTSDPIPKVVEKPPMQPRFENAKVASIISKLQTQVKQLQEENESYKTREQLILDQSKAKTSEVVSRWEERKKLQVKCDKLKLKLEESEATCKKLKESNLALRTLIERLEREKILLDTQIRRKTNSVTIAEKPVSAEAQLAKLRTKLATNEEECASLRRQLEHHKRVADDVPRFRAELSTLRGKYETQRESAVQMQSKIARLEATNLELNLKVDDLRNSSRNTDRGDDSDEGMSREELQRTVLMLGQHVRKLQEKLRSAREGSGDSASAEASQKLHTALRRKLSLENEVSQLKHERTELSAQLHQKVKILVEVRAALQEASLREAALKSEIASLRRMK
ncbi:paramyosin-like [Cloeon dipterum]|uniref:paramyosin-like n=1 Tax=Cloeon dipterum TaxID=197152 RepID=UPI00321FDB78